MKTFLFCRYHAFTVMELAGVLAILSILSSVMVPSVIHRIEDAYIEKEREDLLTIGNALKQRIVRLKSIPTDSWTSLCAEELGIPLSRITRSSTGSSRLLLIDAAMQVGTEGTTQLPYTQTSLGSTVEPSNVRLMLVSSHRLNFPSFLLSGYCPTPEIFETLWNTPAGQVPPGWPPDWAGHGDRLFVFRIDLTPMFCRLVINNLTPGRFASISIGNEDPFSVQEEGWSSYYFKDTLVGLCIDGLVEKRDLLTEARSYVYENGLWRGVLRDGKSNAAAFAQALEAFRGARQNSASPTGYDQTSVVAAYHRFALSYSTWAQAGFPAADSPEYQSLAQSHNLLRLAAGYLLSR